MPLNALQRHQLRRKAQQLKPVVIIGQNGLTAAVQQEINQALIAHELIKVKASTNAKEQRQLWTEAICSEQQAQLIQTIGHMIVIYRPNPE